MHTKFQGHRPFGSREEDFLRFLPYMGLAAILVMWLGPFEQTFVPPFHRSSIWNLTLIGPVVSEEKMFKECGRRRTTTADDDDVRRTTEAYLFYKLTKWAFGSGELKNWEKLNYSESTSNRQAFSSRALHYIWENGMVLFFFEQKKIKDSCLYWIFNIELFKISLWELSIINRGKR